MRPRAGIAAPGRVPCVAIVALGLAALAGCGAPAPAAPADPPAVSAATPAASTETASLAPPGPTETLTPAPSPPPDASPSTSPTAPPQPASTRVRVAGTEGQGANLRQEPDTQARVLKTVREGAELTVIGSDREAAGLVWRNVRDDDGVGGWMAAEVLQVVPPTPTPSPADLAAPCRVGQLKGDASTGVYYRPGQAEYGRLRERVRCFDSESQARATGYREP